MCGRYLITSSPEAMRNLFRYAEEPDFPPRYNVAPTQPVPVVRLVHRARSVAPDACDFWLDCTGVDALMAGALITAAPENLFEAYEISTAVNRTANDTPDVIAPLGEQPEPAPPPRRASKPKKDDGQASLF